MKWTASVKTKHKRARNLPTELGNSLVSRHNNGKISGPNHTARLALLHTNFDAKESDFFIDPVDIKDE